MRTLDALEGCKGKFGRAAAVRTSALLERLAKTRLRDPTDLIRLHETALFLRAFPQSPRVARLTDELLLSFAERIRNVDPALFDDPAVSGIAGTAVSTNFSHEFAGNLIARHGKAIQVDWDNFDRSDRLGGVLGRLIPQSYEDYAVAPHADWRAWLEKTATHPAAWLARNVDPATYDLLEVPLRWDLGSSPASRSALRLPGERLFHHSGPFLKRSDVSIEREFAAPALPVRALAARLSKAVVGVIVDASAARYRELYGFQHPDSAHIRRADLGRGVQIYFFGVPPSKRLPVHAYHSGMFFKNGVPMGYVETLSVPERCEVGFNLYYTFREGETAWLYARILKLLRERLGVTCFSIDPYQLGHENEEAIASGAFWFYYKLGFRPSARDIASLAEIEAAKAAEHPGYRTPPAILRRLAKEHLSYGGACAERQRIPPRR